MITVCFMVLFALPSWAWLRARFRRRVREGAVSGALAGAEVLGVVPMQIFFAVIGASANIGMVLRVGPGLALMSHSANNGCHFGTGADRIDR